MSTSTPVEPPPPMTDAELKRLCKLLTKFGALIGHEQPLAGQVVSLVHRWVDNEIT